MGSNNNFLQKMENYEGDLADIVRASGGGATTGSLSSSSSNLNIQEGQLSDWQQLIVSNQIDYPLGIEEQQLDDEFGDPFSNTGDPLLHGIDLENMAASSCFFNNNNSNKTTDIIIRSNFENTGRRLIDGGGGGPKFGDEDIIRRSSDSNNIFSRMLQISPNSNLSSPHDSPVLAASPRGGGGGGGVVKPPTLTGNEMNISTTVNCSKTSFVENGGVQISSPRSTGIKRRKSQAKKVVCIPAPTPANSRPSGEVVPSDLWAWRKYGQKPIKGSPYPRGYYRCSSSKGCSARKQVERSRTDPNMLVITYTSEHNHPWPTQRNALAGSTRSSQPSKTGSASKTSSNNTSQQEAVQTNTNLKEEQKESLTPLTDNVLSSSIGPSVKEEIEDQEEDLDDNYKQMEILDNVVEFNEGFQQSYKPSLPAADSNRSEDFFADLGELEVDPLNLLFTTQGYSGELGGGRQNKALLLDPFSFYDWTDNHNHRNNSSIQEPNKKGS